MPPFQCLRSASSDLSVIIASFNTRQILLSCLASLYDHTQDIGFEVFVVDNGSTDGSAQAVAENFPQVTLIKNSENRGLSAAFNQGIRESGSRYIALLNSDTALIENCFLKLIRFLDDNTGFAVCSPQIIDETGEATSMRLWQDTPQDAFWRILGKYDVAGQDSRMGKIETKETETLGGSCLIIRRALFEIIGLMDENYFLYNEEDDLCRRARMHGQKIGYFPETSIKHLRGKSTHLKEIRERVIIETYKSYLYFFSKYYSTVWNWILRSTYCATFIVGIPLAIWRRFVKNEPPGPDNSIALKLKLLFMKEP
ncbi:MAG: glycosyltransferase family 2 protein [Nitrospinota bacterium]|nr:glycosyltransferase family 2 protein [Nitrospinota bacterium]